MKTSVILCLIFGLYGFPVCAQTDAQLQELASQFAMPVDTVKIELKLLLNDFYSVTGPPRKNQWRSSVRVQENLNIEQAIRLFKFSREHHLLASDLIARCMKINNDNLDGSIAIEEMVEEIVDPERLGRFTAVARELPMTPVQAKIELLPFLNGVHYTMGPPRAAQWRSNVRVSHSLSIKEATQLYLFARSRNLTDDQVIKAAQRIDSENLDGSMSFSDLKDLLLRMSDCEFDLIT